MARDKISEIEALRLRGLYSFSKSHEVIDELQAWWITQEKSLGNESDQVITKLVTIIEVTLRSIIRLMVDSVEGYAQKALEITKQSQGLKLDFATLHAVQRKKITLGQIVSHNIPLSNISEIYSVINQFIGEDIYWVNSQAVALLKKRYGNSSEIVEVLDVTILRQSLHNLLEARHIVVHEIPNNRPYAISDIEKFFICVKEFTGMLVQVCLFKTHREYFEHKTLEEAEAAGRHQMEQLNLELDKALLSLNSEKNNKQFQEAQSSWEEYRRRQSDYVSSKIGSSKRGIINRLFYSMEYKRLTSIRINELNGVIEESVG